MSDENGKPHSGFDTDRQYLGAVYAKALMGMNTSSGNSEALVEELESFVATLVKLPKLRSALESPRIGFVDKERIIDRALASRASKPFVNFLKVVARKGRTDCLGSIARAARRMHDEAAGRLQATMTTAQPVDESIQRNVAERLGRVLGKEINLATHVDPEILGGLMVRVGDTVYDGSIRNQLDRIRVQVIDRASHRIRGSLERFATES